MGPVRRAPTGPRTQRCPRQARASSVVLVFDQGEPGRTRPDHHRGPLLHRTLRLGALRRLHPGRLHRGRQHPGGQPIAVTRLSGGVAWLSEPPRRRHSRMGAATYFSGTKGRPRQLRIRGVNGGPRGSWNQPSPLSAGDSGRLARNSGHCGRDRTRGRRTDRRGGDRTARRRASWP